MVFRRSALSVALLALACDRDPAPPRATSADSATPRAPAVPSVSAPASAVPAAPLEVPELSIQVVEAGSAPLAELAYDLATQGTWRGEIGVSSQARIQADALDPVEQPPQSTTLLVSYDAVGEKDGVIRIRRRVDDVRFDDTSPGARGSQALAAFAAAMKGMTVEYGFSRRGVTSAARTDASSLQASPSGAVLENLRTALGQLAVPLPSEPVGVGATWRVTSDSVMAGMRIAQSTTFTLKRRADDELTIASTMQQTGRPGPLEVPGASAGVTTYLVSLDGKGTGVHHVDLSSPLVRGELKIETDVVMRVETSAVTRVVRSHNVVEVETRQPKDGGK